jgi:DNA-binding NtrC family response regulator
MKAATFHDQVRAFRRGLLAQAIRECGGNRTRAAALLGLQRAYLLRLVRELGFRAEVPAGRPGWQGRARGVEP